MARTIVDAARLSEKGQLVIPKEIRDMIGLKTGSRLIVVMVDDAIVLHKAEIVAERMRFKDLVQRARIVTQKLTRR